MRSFSAKPVMSASLDQNRDIKNRDIKNRDIDSRDIEPVRSERGAVLVMMLAIVLMLSMGIGVSVTWIQTGIAVAQRAERALVIEESLNAALQIATWDLKNMQVLGCEDWVPQIYWLNELHVAVGCVSDEGESYLHAELGARSARVRVTLAMTLGAGDDP